jgi:cysteine desulfuration protein SufE
MLQDDPFNSCILKQQNIISLLSACLTAEEKYCKIIELGRQLPAYHQKYKTPENLVTGCQSSTYLHASLESEKVIFLVHSEALISAGLAALLISVYNEESAKTILTCPPTFLDTIGIRASLTPSRANGLYSIYHRMKQDALRLLVANSGKL